MPDENVTALEDRFGSLGAEIGTFRLTSLADILKDYKPITWSVEGLFADESVNVVFGGYGTYKSFLCLDLALHVAHGIPWHGYQIKQGPAIYVAGEGHRGISTRLVGWHKYHAKIVQDATEAPFYLTHASWPLTDDQSAQMAADSVARYCDKIGQAPAHITIDTLARNFGDGDENSSGDVGVFYSNVEQHFRDRFGCTIVVVAHTGHSNTERPRGSYNIIAAADSVYQMNWEIPPDMTGGSGVGLVLECHKQKDSEMAEPIHFDHETVDLEMLDNFGNPITTKVVRRSVSNLTIPPGLGRNERTAYKALASLYNLAKKNLESGGLDQENVLVRHLDWRDECFRQGMIKQRFYDAKKALEEHKKLIEIRGLHVILKAPEPENNDLDDNLNKLSRVFPELNDNQ